MSDYQINLERHGVLLATLEVSQARYVEMTTLLRERFPSPKASPCASAGAASCAASSSRGRKACACWASNTAMKRSPTMRDPSPACA